MARWRPTRSSAKPLRAPSSLERSRNRGCTRFIWKRVSTADRGTVTKNTPVSLGEMNSSIRKEPTTVKALVLSCRKSAEMVAFTVSTS